MFFSEYNSAKISAQGAVAITEVTPHGDVDEDLAEDVVGENMTDDNESSRNAQKRM